MNATSTFRPRASSPRSVELESAIGSPAATRAPTSTIGRWLMQVPWLVRTNLLRTYSSSSPASVSTWIRSAVTLVTTPAWRAIRTWPESCAARTSMPVPTIGRLGLEQRHGLALHVRAHQGAVGVVVLEERDERGGDRDDLLGRDVHVVDLVRARLGELVAVARRDPLGQEVAGGVERRVGLGDDVLLFLVGGQVLDLGGHDRPDRECLGLLLLELGGGGGVELLAGLDDDACRPWPRGRCPASNSVSRGIVEGDGPLDLAVGRLDEAVAR